ncbi:murein biosynthesis integral membrane protein MurJ [Buchnera aphidicola (Hyadaphis tataricae)]|uniref:Probable lipid II flippase MurJ n=1 Tax=Buchnera aphidicola (Hyadaphis tataricae) TaxID=1241859 RepID=A0A4D6Y6F3_9GAMM|nr:murein biosynthesis integral membrane protein MurJ [Buchnera aphidicola]QCI21631.1 murein biosynthesis integral membrane protein MurJ [Buchnera aphidicola (Hyadaphis tataricae)]
MNLLKSLISVSLMTLISRILGFIRDILIASIFGVSIFTDAFFVSFKIPNLLRRIFSEGAFSQAFVPVLMEYKSNHNKKKLREFISSTLGCMCFFLFIVTILGMCFSKFLILINAPGFINFPEKLNLSEHLLQIMFPYIFVISLSSLCSSILNSWNFFSVPAFSPIFLNISIIFVSVFFSSFFNPSVLSLAWAVIIGGLCQLFYQLPFLYKINMLVVPHFNWHNRGLITVLKKIGPAILGCSATQISLILNTIFSSLLNAGSISWIYYADRLVEFPIGILGVPLSTILFTALTNSYKKNRILEGLHLLNWGFRISVICAVPGAALLFFLAKPIIIVLFQYGKFTDFDVLMIDQVLKYYSFGLIAFILVKIFSAAFYACEAINVPMKISFFTLIVTQCMNPFCIFYFQHAGLALSISIASWINLALLSRELYRRKMLFFTINELIFIVRIILSTLFMILILSIMLKFMVFSYFDSLLSKITRLVFVFFVSGFGYLLMLHFLGIRLLALSYNIS